MSNVDLSLEDLGPYLEANVTGFSGLRYIDKFAGGQSNPTYRLTADTGNYVLRRKPFGKLLKSAHAVEREFRVMHALADTDVPVPRMLHLCEDDEVIGATFFIMDFIHARHFWDPSLPELDNAHRTAVYDEMNRVLAALHTVDVDAVGLTDFGHPGNYFERQVARWTKQYRASETDTIEAMDALIEWLPANTPPDDGRVSLIHGDYRLDNLFFAEGSDHIIAVLDWELSTLGHPFADLAYQCMQLRMPADSPIKGLAGLDRGALGIPDEGAYVERYCERTGIGEVRDWPFCLAFCFFRLAAILQGVKKRALDGNASSTKALEYGAYTASLAAMGVGIVEGTG